MYSEKVMDHFTNPRNVGEIENASGVGTVGNAKCGDIMRIYLDIDDNGIINDVKFKTFMKPEWFRSLYWKMQRMQCRLHRHWSKEDF